MACLPPPLSIPPLDPVQHGNALQPGSVRFEVLLDALEATDMPLKHDHIPAQEKTNDGRPTKESNAEMSSMTHAFLRQNIFPSEVMNLT